MVTASVHTWLSNRANLKGNRVGPHAMDAGEFREALEASKATQLDRLASNKLLLALTDADLETEPVLEAAAASEYAAAETFRQWADDEADRAARDLFATVADQEADHLDRVVAQLPAFDPPDAAGPLHAFLRGVDATVPRVAGGLVARGLVSSRSHTQIIGFFINEAEQELADLFRDLKAETDAEIDAGLTYLDENAGDDDWEPALSTAEYVIQIAYDDYADGLRDLGLDPKPIC